MNEVEICDRCKHPVEVGDVASWDAITYEDGTVGTICTGCLTGEEVQTMDEDEVELATRLTHCPRCGRPAPSFGFRDPETVGWYVLDDGVVCAACTSPQEMD